MYVCGLIPDHSIVSIEYMFELDHISDNCTNTQP